MARRKNAFSPEDNATKPSQTYTVDDFESAMTLFLRDGKIRNISPYTLGLSQQELGKFRHILDKQHIGTDPSKITEKIVKENVILYLMDDGQKETPINCVLRAVRAFFNYLVREGYLAQSPMLEAFLH